VFVGLDHWTGLGTFSLALTSVPAAVDQETVRVTLEPLTTEEASRIWALFPTANYRTSIAYLATPVWIDPPAPLPVAAAVIQDQLRSGASAARDNV
jgi:hypothetical protein